MGALFQSQNMESAVASTSRLAEDIILITYLRENITLDVEEVAVGWDQATVLDPEKNSFVVVQTAPWSLMDKDARAYISSQMPQWPAVAVVVHNAGQKILGQVTIRVAGLAKQVKFFDDQESALSWLDSQRIMADEV